MTAPHIGQTKYAPLLRVLVALPADQASITLTLTEIAAIIGAPLPLSAHTPGYWSSSAAVPLLHRAGWRATLTWKQDIVTFRRRAP